MEVEHQSQPPPQKEHEKKSKKLGFSTPMDYILQSIRIISVVLLPIGINVSTDCRVYWLSYLCGVAAIQHAILTFYTIHYYWDKNKISALQPITVLAISIPGGILYVQSVNYLRFRLRSIFHFGANYIFIDRVPGNDFEREQLRLSKILYQKTVSSLVLIVFSYSLLVTGPIYGYFYLHEYNIPTGTILPFIDPATFRGFMANVSFQTAVGIAAVMGTIGVETIISICSGTLEAMTELTVFHIRKFDENITTNNGNHSKEFHNILTMTEDIIMYADRLNQVFYWRILMQPTFTTICVATGIFSQYANNWSPGYGLAAGFLIQLFIICHVGNQFIFLSERLQNELYNIKWYLLPPSQARNFIMPLQRWKVGVRLRMGPFGELNYGTATDVVRRVYTFLMILLKYV